MDVETAFLNAELKEDIYVHPPPGLERDDFKVYKLHKSLYGLKQSPREWNNNINGFLVASKYSRVQADSCIYVRTTDRGTDMIAVYVDDLIICGSSTPLINSVKN